MISVVLLLGGNIGQVEATFRSVERDLEREVGAIESRSDVFRSEAWGFAADDFLNRAVILSTELAPETLLDTLQSIEQRWGRNREAEMKKKMDSGERYLSRAIDIDIIFYGDLVLRSERLTLPHPLLAERKFVLEPIAQIAPHRIDPKVGKSVAQMLSELTI